MAMSAEKSDAGPRLLLCNYLKQKQLVNFDNDVWSSITNLL